MATDVDIPVVHGAPAPTFRVLGPLESTVDGLLVSVGGPRQRVVLAMLIIERGRTVSVDRLVSAVWGDKPPATARTQIAVCVSALRRSLTEAGATDDVIRTHPPGYLLRVPAEHVDTEVVDRLVGAAESAVAQGRYEHAVTLLREALRQWRGESFAGLRSEPVEAAATSLEERRLALVEEVLSLELAVGRGGQLVGEIGAYVERYPFRERLRGQLMLALNLAGRHVEALESYRGFSAFLAAELGLDPGPELRQLHSAMLRGEHTNAGGYHTARPVPSAVQPPAASMPPAPMPQLLVPPATTPPVIRLLPRDEPTIVGRGEELAELSATLRPADRSLRLAVVTGIGGVGKTSLAVHWAHRVADHFPDGHIFVDLRGRDRQPVAPAVVLEQMLGDIGELTDRPPTSVDQLAAMWRAVSTGRRILLVLDDAASPQQVRPLLPGAGDSVVVVTSRHRLDELTVRERAHTVGVQPLPTAAAAAFLADAGVTGDDHTLRRLAYICDGLPFALHVIANRLTHRPGWMVESFIARARDGRYRLDELRWGELGLREILGWSYARLTGPAAALLRRTASLPVRDFAPWVAAVLLRVDLAQAEETLTELADAHLVTLQRTDAAGQPRFRVPSLVRTFAIEHASPDEGPQGGYLHRVQLLAGSLAREAGVCRTSAHRFPNLPPLSAAAVCRLLMRPGAWLRAERVSLRALALDRRGGPRRSVAR